jgi:uncharacterized membrane protein
VEDDDQVRLLRPPSWRLWIGSGSMLVLAGLAAGFVALMIGSDEALAAKPWLTAAGLMIGSAFVLVAVGLVKAVSRR